MSFKIVVFPAPFCPRHGAFKPCDAPLPGAFSCQRGQGKRIVAPECRLRRHMQFSEQKAAQVAAFFLHRAGGRMEILKLMKLMYLAERASYQKFGEPMIGDKLVSMDNGPALSITLNHMNRFAPSEPGGWESWVSDRNNYVLALAKQVSDPKEDLLQLSDAELEIMESVWKEYGKYGSFQLADLTHEICPEWEDPHGSSLPITQSRLLRSLGFDAQTAKALEERIAENRHLDAAFSRR